jgi:hypothetical protein
MNKAFTNVNSDPDGFYKAVLAFVEFYDAASGADRSAGGEANRRFNMYCCPTGANCPLGNDKKKIETVQDNAEICRSTLSALMDSGGGGIPAAAPDPCS